MINRNRQRGRAWENKVVNLFKDHDYKAERNLTETREGATGDVWVYDKSNRIRMIVECKATTRDPSKLFTSAYKQAVKGSQRIIQPKLPCPLPVVAIKHMPRKGYYILVDSWYNGKQYVDLHYSSFSRVWVGPNKRACMFRDIVTFLHLYSDILEG